MLRRALSVLLALCVPLESAFAQTAAQLKRELRKMESAAKKDADASK